MSATELTAAQYDKIHASFASQGVMTAWDARMTALRAGFCELTLPFSERVAQQHGFFHGGVIGALADSAAGYAGYTALGPEGELVTAEYKLNILAPGLGDTLIGRGKIVKSGRTLIVTTAEVFVRRDGQETLCALMQQTLFALPSTPKRA
ncbi:PaaI family thioesterase [Pandoraea sp.]|uniref:PaaI family thioesterase n=1 Tax=Pandoraea sp. TaxID=1883445 RepID=UPI0011FD5B7D|nr:PaaI family thioesterase [Pandoraea sp.]MBU6492434.1 PaaI family thioesterase [Burkholderiales bacterium]MDE2288676.1 PaaI family thioesterase [Burkholderiales bacterium]MDE2609002.1 PaaI family thioesterase [Burkholderiales bacterium]TAL52121.1 MAG: PaaI family thioesterase [Pandoraea sp.]TAM16012.1 MAG: PaaI family thioesterase [Pandoraea sp.]